MLIIICCFASQQNAAKEEEKGATKDLSVEEVRARIEEYNAQVTENGMKLVRVLFFKQICRWGIALSNLKVTMKPYYFSFPFFHKCTHIKNNQTNLDVV